jgi:hypothetical protein
MLDALSLRHPRLTSGVLAIALLSIAVAGGASTGAATSVTQTFAASADAYVSSNKPSTNYGNDSRLRVNGSPIQRAYFGFTLTGLSGTVTRATLRLNAANSSTGYEVHSAGSGWSESAITFNNAPPPSPSIAGVSGPTSSGQWNSIDVTPLVTGNGNVSFVATTSSGSTNMIASRENGSATAPQLVVETSTPSAPANTNLPTISGSAQQGQILTASVGSWTGTAPISYAYQWRRCDGGGGSCIDIEGGTAAAYTPAAADIGSTIRVAVTASNSVGSSSASSQQTAVVAAAPVAPANTSPPTISGLAQQDQTLTASVGSWTGTAPIGYAYQWRRCDAGGGGCVDVAGATGTGYTLVSADVGATIRVAVTASNSAGSSGATSAQTSVVVPPPASPPTNTSPPTISGTAQQDQTLTAAAGSWTGAQPISYAYQWRRCDSGGGGCVDIAGASGTGYTLVGADVGATIRVAVTASNSAGSSNASSGQTAVVAAAPIAPANSSPPTISGTAQQGQTLTADPGSWTGTQPITHAYQWRRCDTTGSGCTDIAGATTNAYVSIAADVGSTLLVLVTGSNSAGSSQASSAATGVVASSSSAPVNTAPPTVAGTAQAGQTLTANPGTWTGTPPITYGYQWQRCVATYPASVGSGSPLGYWRVGEATGATAVDDSGSGRNGSYAGGYTLAQPGALTGDSSTAVRLNGTSGRISVPDSPGLAYGDVFTYEAWVKLAAGGITQSLFQKGTGAASLYIGPDNLLRLRKAGSADVVTATQPLSADGAFHYIVATKNGAAVKLYVDGNNVTGSVANLTMTSTTSPLGIGVSTSGTNFLNGWIDEIGVYGVALSADQVRQHYVSGTNANGCTDVAGATATSYVETSSDVGRSLRVVVTATNTSGSTTASSAWTPAVGTAPSPPPPPPGIGYRDQSFVGAGVAPSGSKPESKLWWNDGFWWADMWATSSQSFHIFRLNVGSQTWVDTGTPLDNRSGTRADALWDGTHLYVVSHVFATCGCSTSSTGTPSRLYRFSYDTAAKTYSLDAGFPVAINDTQTETLVLDKDSTGTLWATWAQDGQVYVTHSGADDKTWVPPFALPVTGATGLNTDDISSIVRFGGNKIGVMWSNEVASAMYFAVHVDGQPDNVWDPSRTAIQGPNNADDHINLKSLQADTSGRVYAVVKTSLDDLSNPNPNAPLIMLLVRDGATGDWASYVIGRVSDHHTRPILLLDDQHQVIHVFATAPVVGGTIYEKTTPMGSISFAAGLGTPFIQDPNSPNMNNATTTKQSVNSQTGLVVLAGDDSTGFYWHGYASLSP